ncbi:MAG: acylphosphatase [Candidatus Diapherotrites archaeon]|nr:acylphosphatase [Candidatus Diapherotrites archaeon]
MPAKKAAYIRVYGHVQGVFFRAFTRDWASRLGLQGYVRNMPDGSVEIVAEGSEDCIKELIEKVRIGPPAASVERIEVKWQQASNAYNGFRIEY